MPGMLYAAKRPTNTRGSTIVFPIADRVTVDCPRSQAPRHSPRSSANTWTVNAVSRGQGGYMQPLGKLKQLRLHKLWRTCPSPALQGNPGQTEQYSPTVFVSGVQGHNTVVGHSCSHPRASVWSTATRHQSAHRNHRSGPRCTTAVSDSALLVYPLSVILRHDVKNGLYSYGEFRFLSTSYYWVYDKTTPPNEHE